MSGLARRLVRNFGLIALFLAAALFGIASGVLFAFVDDLPQISALEDYSASTITRVLGRDGSVIGEFAKERRQLVTYEEIPPVLRNAIVAAEDSEFFKHSGLSIPRIAMAFLRNVYHWRITGGASTLTQQLARKLFLTDDQTPERKIKEALLAIQIEKRFTKEQIFTLYCNQVYWGHSTYGVQGASQLYFAKPAKDLTLNEAAMIAGIIQGNARQSPYNNMPKAVQRRNYTLDRMAAEGYITAAERDETKKQPITVRGVPKPTQSIAPYFLENVRLHLEELYGAKAVYESGLTVRTGLDPQLQLAANRALDANLRRLDKLRGYRKPLHNLLAEGKAIETYKEARWDREPAAGGVLPAVVTAVEAGTIRARVGKYQAAIDRDGYKWTNRRVDDVARTGDVIEIRVKALDAKTGTIAAELEQTPELEGAVVAIDNHTGNILAMVGGRNFERSQFNRATQALRQVGSLFKPFVYTTAVDRGFTAASLLDDKPVSYPTGPGQPLYEPRNFDRKFEDEVTLRWALEESRNVPTVGLMATLGPAQVIRTARNMGITTYLPEYLSVAIGAAEGTLLEMTSAYSAFPNQGVRMTPLSVLDVTDREGNVMEQARPESHDALRADTAYIMTSLLQGVIQEGTAKRAKSMDWPLGGKTGTTDDVTDAWFVGFDPEITIGVWVGFDQKKSIGAREEGASAALPMWMDVMQAWIDRQRQALPQPPVFERPGNIVYAMGPKGVMEVFIAGTAPDGKH